MTTASKIAYVQAAWHTDITDRCKQAFTAELARHGYDVKDVEFFSAPGSLEIPLMAKKLAKTGRYAAVCVSGFVVDGGIYRHEFVANAVLQGIVQTSLETEVPSSRRSSPHIISTTTRCTTSSSGRTWRRRARSWRARACPSSTTCGRSRRRARRAMTWEVIARRRSAALLSRCGLGSPSSARRDR